MFKFLISSEIGMFKVRVSSEDWFTLGELSFVDDVPEYIQQYIKDSLLSEGRSPYGPGFEQVDTISPQDLNFSCNLISSFDVFVLEGKSEDIPLDPQDKA
ncbi:hypothetical protein KO489_10550 [Reinekea forsetii]|nr:hypothetical protein [Reinekea forsetii]